MVRVLKEGLMSKPHLDLTVQVWYGEGGAIHLSSDDPRLVDPDGKRKGLNMAISRTKQPKTFKRVDDLLRREGVTRR
jgi:hypothetical protein